MDVHWHGRAIQAGLEGAGRSFIEHVENPRGTQVGLINDYIIHVC